MKISTIKLNVTALAALLTTSLFIPHVAAAPGSIATQPLQTSASAESNVMFVLDSSGSMSIISPETFTHVFTCSVAGAILADTKVIDLNINAGEPEITNVTDSVTRSLGNNASSYCFDPTKYYTASLTTDPSVGTWGRVEYKGDYLNWYFDSSNDGTTSWVYYKPTAKTRLQVAQLSLNGLLDTLKSVNVGLSTFSTPVTSNGAAITLPVAAIDAAHLTSLKAAVTATVATGGTPLAETLRDLGRYFASGDGNNGSTSGECGGAASTDLYLYPDNFPVTTSTAPCDDFFANTDYTKDSDATGKGPIEFFCQKNFAVMLTDGFPTNDDDLSSYLTDYDKDCEPDAQTAGSYTCDSADDTKSYDDATLQYDYWDDVAQALYDIDLRPDLNDQQGNAFKNNLATYTVGFADKQIKDLQLIKDAALQGGGESYYAENADDLSQILLDINAKIEGQSGTAAAVTFNSSTLSSQSAVYQALFNTTRWSGQLHSIPLDGFTGDVLTTDCTDAVAEAGTMINCWNAEQKLDAQTSRTIVTYNPISQRGVDFAYNASSQDYTTITSSDTTSEIIPKTMIDDFCASHDIPFPCDASTAADSTKVASNMLYMEDLVNYLRGDRTHEDENSTLDFRRRTHKLGDIVNSSPVYVGKPSLGWPSTSPFPYPVNIGDPDYSYSTWVNTGTDTDGDLIKDRMPIVYVAANDGMLHGVRTLETDPVGDSNDAGEEVLAFIPSSTADTGNTSGLHYLANPNYDHKFYVDLNPALSDVYIKHRDTTSGSVTSTEEWRTVLIGGQGAGGNTMFMLDVTDPQRFSAANVKELVEWEFSQPNMGYTYSKPTIAMMNNGRFAAIFGNGYNSDEFGGDCKAKLFVVFLDGGVDGTWDVGTDPSSAATDYMEIDTTIGDGTDCNGLSTPAVVDLNGDKVADKAYAGDMYGNLWSFDLCNWDSVNLVCQDTGWGLPNGGSTTPITTATDGATPTATPQPITVKPVVSRDPDAIGIYDLIIVFGTGQYLANGDVTTTTVQSFYGIRHYDAMADGGIFGLDSRSNKTTEQIIEEKACTQAGCIGDVRLVSNGSLNSTDTGWYIDFDFNDAAANPVDGERIVVNPKIRNNTVFFNTVIPDDRKCYAGGDGWLMSVNLANGGQPLTQVFDLNNDGIFDSNDQEGGENPAGQKVFAIPAESTFLGDNQYTPDSEGNISKRKVNIGKTQREGRMSWKELYEDN